MQWAFAEYPNWTGYGQQKNSRSKIVIRRHSQDNYRWLEDLRVREVKGRGAGQQNQRKRKILAELPWSQPAIAEE